MFVDEIFGYNTHLKIEAEPTEETEKLLEVSQKLTIQLKWNGTLTQI